MAKRKKAPATLTITSEQQFDLEKPRYNAHQVGHGAHKSAKVYQRKPKHGKAWE